MTNSIEILSSAIYNDEIDAYEIEGKLNGVDEVFYVQLENGQFRTVSGRKIFTANDEDPELEECANELIAAAVKCWNEDQNEFSEGWDAIYSGKYKGICATGGWSWMLEGNGDGDLRVIAYMSGHLSESDCVRLPDFLSFREFDDRDSAIEYIEMLDRVSAVKFID